MTIFQLVKMSSIWKGFQKSTRIRCTATKSLFMLMQGSHAENDAGNDVLVLASGDYTGRQSNDQSIDDVKKDSSAGNDAGNSVSFDDSDGDGGGDGPAR